MTKSINDLPPEILKEISSHLPTKTDLTVDRKTRTLFQPPAILSKFLEFVAHGKQEHAEKIVTIRKKAPEQLQELLLARGIVTDYSGRTFTNISAYEYAYWAKDTHMCRMLEKHMDEKTKAAMLKRCDAIEINGLTFKQQEVEVKGSTHFDLTPLKTALNNYAQGYDNWYNTNNGDAVKAAWMQVRLAQRDLPVHVINEYCRKDLSFHPTRWFEENKLPRVVTFHNFVTSKNEEWFPLVVSDSSGLGVDGGAVALRWSGVAAAAGWACSGEIVNDFAAIVRLDEVRTADLTQSRKNLSSTEPGLDDDYRPS